MWIEVGRVSADTQRFQIRDLQDDHEYMIRIFARNEVGLSEPLESEEPYKVLPMTGNNFNKFEHIALVLKYVAEAINH